jgi:5-hydroxyisourate hydrolase
VAERPPTISTHVLDTGRGRPAAGLKVTLFKLDVDGRPIRVTESLTDGDGRVQDLLGRPLQSGVYRLRFDVPDGVPVLFKTMAVDFEITDVSRSYHVSLLPRAVLDEHVPGTSGVTAAGRAGIALDIESIDLRCRVLTGDGAFEGAPRFLAARLAAARPFGRRRPSSRTARTIAPVDAADERAARAHRCTHPRRRRGDACIGPLVPRAGVRP